MKTDFLTVNVALDERAYPIHIGNRFDLIDALPSLPERILLVSDSHVAPLYTKPCQAAMVSDGRHIATVTIPAGEASKSLQSAEHLYAAAAAAELDRGSAIIALGGGVVGDLAGFVAATYLRGLAFYQIPTTLLAMVDSSVGGKTAVNIEAGKNLVGCFHQPRGVAINLETLQSLPDREYRSGLAEVLKYGLILDADFYADLCGRVDDLRNRDPEVLSRVIARCCELKAQVVVNDERESGMRALLNFGHTLAHAIETLAGYGTYLHGEAVSIGMVYAARLSQRRGHLGTADVDALERILVSLNLPIRLPDPADAWPGLRSVMQRDKKTLAGKPRFVLLEGIGRARAGCTVEDDELMEAWQEMHYSEEVSI